MSKRRTKQKQETLASTAHPPVRRPVLLAASVVLFVLWFVFLLVTALALV